MKDEILEYFKDINHAYNDCTKFDTLKCMLGALEQEPKTDTLDKIRAEIENHCGLVKENHCKYCSYCNSVMGVREIIEIIDKYKAESEGRNDG